MGCSKNVFVQALLLSPRGYFLSHPERSEGSLGTDVSREATVRDCRPEPLFMSPRAKRGMPRYRSAGQSRGGLF